MRLTHQLGEGLGTVFTSEHQIGHGFILRGVQFASTGLPTWGSGQPGQVGNQAALTVEPVLGSRLVTFANSWHISPKLLPMHTPILQPANHCSRTKRLVKP